MPNRVLSSVLLRLLLIAFLSQRLVAQDPAKSEPKIITYAAPTKENYRKFADEAEHMLRQEILGKWFPACVDNVNGGFNANFDRQWKPGKSEGKFSVFQGRMTWIAAEVVMRRPDLKDQYLPIVHHGLEYLNNVLWDKKYGGFYWGLQDDGNISPTFSSRKHLYGISFGIYGAAAGYQATKDPKALELAQKAFRWTDEHAHDGQNGGYFELLTEEGKVVVDHDMDGKIPSSLIGGPIGYKSMNTHIHLLESFTQLYQVWKDETLRKRVEELLATVRDKISIEPGAMNLYFTNDWRAIPDHDSYGHDVETTYLMLEAEDVLGHGHDPKTERMAKMLADHALAYGWDENMGGIYGDGAATGNPENTKKEWWVEFEALNTFLLLHEKYGQQTDVYFKAFQRQWQYLKNYQIDHEYGGDYPLVDASGKPVTVDKGSIWKAAYHDSRALMNVTERLDRLARNASH
ncbi:MAG TPA: AGE family epimerase/isomerase [Terriglobales bacterium]|nr:AGE family epimerase/isomerase [Terriglobales bacterium]